VCSPQCRAWRDIVPHRFSRRRILTYPATVHPFSGADLSDGPLLGPAEPPLPTFPRVRHPITRELQTKP
jgi:hypothetical protein